MSTRYDNMTAGYTLYEAGRVLGTLFPDDTQRLLDAARIIPSGGTTHKPRFSRRHVDELGQIRKSQQRPAAEQVDSR